MKEVDLCRQMKLKTGDDIPTLSTLSSSSSSSFNPHLLDNQDDPLHPPNPLYHPLISLISSVFSSFHLAIFAADVRQHKSAKCNWCK
jgi:hypothetical protein